MSTHVERVEDRLADFTRDKRVLILSVMALVIGALSAVGSLLAQLFHLSSAERKTLLVAGAERARLTRVSKRRSTN